MPFPVPNATSMPTRRAVTTAVAAKSWRFPPGDTAADRFAGRMARRMLQKCLTGRRQAAIPYHSQLTRKRAMTDRIETLLDERRSFPPAAAFRERAHVRDQGVYARAQQDREAYWAEWARQLEWIRPWDRVLEWTPPHAKWFVGGKLNASVNCLDRHVRAGRGDRVALIWEGEPGEERRLTYADLHEQVNRFGQRVEGPGSGQGRSGRDLPADGAGSGHRDAGLRPHRRAAHSGIRRLFRRVFARPDQRCRRHGADHRRRRLSPRARSSPSSRAPTKR